MPILNFSLKLKTAFLMILFLYFTLSWASFSEMKIYYGGLHSHTSLSDGVAMPEDAFKYARDVAGVDFWAVTDHWDRLDFVGSLGKLGNYIKDSSMNPEKRFQLIKEQAYKEEVPNKFIAIRGFEWNYDDIGHINVFNTDTFIKFSEGQSLEDFYNWLRKQNPEAVAMFNHPSGEGLNIWNNFEYYEDLDKIIDCIEVSNGDFDDYGDRVQYYFISLDKGWHLGPTATEDNHGFNWGTSSENRTAVFIDELNEEKILRALKSHNFYATTDKNLQLYFFANDNPMGSKLSENEINFYIKVIEPDGDKINKVTLYTNGKNIVKEWTMVGENKFEAIYSISLNAKTEVENKTNNALERYYVVEVETIREKGLNPILYEKRNAISSPIWIKL